MKKTKYWQWPQSRWNLIVGKRPDHLPDKDRNKDGLKEKSIPK